MRMYSHRKACKPYLLLVVEVLATVRSQLVTHLLTIKEEVQRTICHWQSAHKINRLQNKPKPKTQNPKPETKNQKQQQTPMMKSSNVFFLLATLAFALIQKGNFVQAARRKYNQQG